MKIKLKENVNLKNPYLIFQMHTPHDMNVKFLHVRKLSSWLTDLKKVISSSQMPAHALTISLLTATGSTLMIRADQNVEANHSQQSVHILKLSLNVDELFNPSREMV
jgi:hypothetical protein